MNTLTYIIYLLVTWIITVHIGLVFYRNGRLYLLNMLQNDEKLTDFVNKLLLVGYYLVNLGYVALMLRFWDTIYTWTELLVSICAMTGKIMLGLAVMHFFNMGVILLLSKRNQITHHKI